MTPNKQKTKTKAKKALKPFRVRQNSIVAMRYKSPPPMVSSPSSENQSSSLSIHVSSPMPPSLQYMEMWLDPVVGRDCHLSLIGKLVRCRFSKKFLKKIQEKLQKGKDDSNNANYDNNSGNGNNKKELNTDCHIFEGEIISTNYSACACASTDTSLNGFQASLLIDKDYLTKMPLLSHVLDEGNHGADSNVRSKDQEEDKRRSYEETCRGKNKVVITILLADIVPNTNTNTTHNNFNRSEREQGQSQSIEAETTTLETYIRTTPLQWVIRKWIPIPPQSETVANARVDAVEYFLGDGYDETLQQERNFRWLSSHEQFTLPISKNAKIDTHQNNNNSDNDDEDNSCYYYVNTNKNYYYIHNHYQIGQVIKIETNREMIDQKRNDGVDCTNANTYTNKKSKTKTNCQSSNAKSSTSLAMVTVKRMILPEITQQGRLANHKWNEIFDLQTDEDVDSGDDNSPVINYKKRAPTLTSTFCVPIEDLIVIARKVKRIKIEHDHDSTNPEAVSSLDTNAIHNDVFTRYTYNLSENSYYSKPNGDQLASPAPPTWQCSEPNSRNAHHQELDDTTSTNDFKRELFHHMLDSQCNDSSAKIRHPHGNRQKENKENDGGTVTSHECKIREPHKNEPSTPSLLSLTEAILQTAQPCDFELPFNFLEKCVVPQPEPFGLSKSKQKRKRKQSSVSITKNKSLGFGQPCTKPAEENDKPALKKKGDLVAQTASITTNTSQHTDENGDEEEVSFKATSARCIPYDVTLRDGVRQVNNSAAHAARSIASNRSGGRKIDRSTGIKNEKDEKNTSSSRAARANQRRRYKENERLGLHQEKKMVGREDVLRFGKSLIHGWGVFSDGNINAGDLIVEYRGVLIGNTIADRREKEYEKAKIGSDYMFRIDCDIVCDATHQGNVARFINASCTPNCYTQIITVNGKKRIAIYAKRDIYPGEELSYDYKFEPEYVESKRIPCNCGTIECRGFMNWNKKYVAITNPNQLAIEQSNQKGKGQGRGL